MRLWLVLCLVCLGACRSASPYPDEAQLARDVRTVVEDPAFTLYSPYDETASRDFANLVRAEVGLVQGVIPDARAGAVRLYLAPLETEQEQRPWETPSNEGLKGAATEGEYAFVYVPARIEASSSLERSTYMRGGTLRHELAHLYANRAGIAGAPWFNEGLALEVESMREAGRTLHTHPCPLWLIAARKSALPGSLEKLLSWTYSDELPQSERSQRYVWSQALFRFLLEQQPEPDFLARARAVHALADSELRAREAAWLVWLGELDALERIRAGANSASADERALGMSVLPMLAENRVPELFTRAADELALAKLADPDCVHPAATFLYFFRPHDLRPEDLEQLERSGDPAREITAQALHARRKEPFDLEIVERAWQRVPQSQRFSLTVPISLVPGWSPRPEPLLRVPAFCAYRRHEWFGRLARVGELELEFEGAAALDARLQVRVSSQADPNVVETRALAEGKASVPIAKAGYYRFALEGAGALPEVSALLLRGPPATGAHFSTVERRNAASVHLGYPVPKESRDEVEWFCIELEPRTEPLYTYYEATGFSRGYFGMQVNSATERRIIFSVWDAGDEAVDRAKVADENRVQLLAKGPGVVAGDFGNEGTGGHSHLVHPWKLGERFRFLLRAEPGADTLAGTTTYTGWFWFAEKQEWGLIASFRAPRDGRFLHGLYSFNENFSGENGDEQRVCLFGNGWVRTHEGQWLPLNEARFTHDGHGETQRLDRSAGILEGRFYLANGGFVDDLTPGAVTRAGDGLKLEKPSGEHPSDAELDSLRRPPP